MLIRHSALIEPSVTGFPESGIYFAVSSPCLDALLGLDLDKRKLPALRVIAGEDV
jgi:hypothetical protein